MDIIQRGLYTDHSGIHIPKDMIMTCSACAGGKGFQSPHGPSKIYNSTPGDYISSDTIRTIHVASGRTHKQILRFIDTASSFIIAKPIRPRTELETLIPHAMNYINSLHGRHESPFHSDNTREYGYHNITSFIHNIGIKKTNITPHKAQ